MDTEEQRVWENRQRKAFSQWVGLVLQSKNVDVLDLSKGVLIFELAEALLQTRLPFKWKKPMSRASNEIEIISMKQRVVDTMKPHGVCLDVSGKDIHQGNLKLIMGMVWGFILKFQVVDKAQLLAWCQKVTAEYGVQISNFGSSWNNGKAFAALVAFIDKSTLSSSQVNKMGAKPKSDLKKALLAAEKIGIARLLEPEDLLEQRPNERIIMLYLSYFYRLAHEPPPEPVDNSAELDYLKAELEAMVLKHRELQGKYETLRLRSKEEADYLINSQQSLLKQFEKVQKERNKIQKKLKTLKAKLKHIEADKESAKRYHVDPPKDGPVTIVCTGVQGTARLWEDFPKVMGAATTLHNALVRNIAYEFQGYEMKCEGDAFTFVFGDSDKAMEFCMKMQIMMPEEQWPKDLLTSADCAVEKSKKDPNVHLFRGLRVKVGLHAGDCQRHEDMTNGKVNFFGPTLTRAQGLCKAAAGGQVLVTLETTEKLSIESKESDSKPNIFPLGEFSFSEIGVVEEVVQVTPLILAGRYFPPILTDANLDDVSQVLADELNRLSEENKKLKSSIIEMEGKAEDARRRAALMKTWLESISEGGDETITQDSEILEISRDIGVLTKEKDDLTEKIANLKEDNENMAKYMESLNKDLQEARSLGYGLKDKVSYLKKENKDAAGEISKLRKEVFSMKKSQSAFLERPKKSDLDDALAQQREIRAREREQAKQKLREFLEKIDEEKSLREQKEKELKAMEKEKRQLEAKLQELMNEGDQEDAKKQKLMDLARKVKGENDAMKIQVEEAQQKSRELERALASQKDNEKKVVQLMNENARLRKQLERKR